MSSCLTGHLATFFTVAQLRNNLCPAPYSELFWDYGGSFYEVPFVQCQKCINSSIPLSVSLPASGLDTLPAI